MRNSLIAGLVMLILIVPVKTIGDEKKTPEAEAGAKLEFGIGATYVNPFYPGSTYSGLQFQASVGTSIARRWMLALKLNYGRLERDYYCFAIIDFVFFLTSEDDLRPYLVFGPILGGELGGETLLWGDFGIGLRARLNTIDSIGLYLDCRWLPPLPYPAGFSGGAYLRF